MNKMTDYFKLIAENRFKEADDYKKSIIPKKLYKFFSLSDDARSNEQKFTTLKGEKLWFSRVNQLNDPFEFDGLYINREKFKSMGLTEEVIEAFSKILTHQKDDYILVSLSENDYNVMPMWAYYTNNYKGFCVEYEVLDSARIFPIQYEANRIPIASAIQQLVSSCSNKSEVPPELDPDMRLWLEIINQQFYIKHASWENENEYRIIWSNNDSKKTGCNVDIKGIGLKTNRIIAGINCSEESLKRLTEISHSLGCGAVQKCAISGNKYVLLEGK